MSLSLTPLRFPQHGTVAGPEPWYGLSTYITNCGRFIIAHVTQFERERGNRGWHITAYGGIWSQWLGDNGLLNERFSTRRETIEALQTCLKGHGLMDAPQPH